MDAEQSMPAGQCIILIAAFSRPSITHIVLGTRSNIFSVNNLYIINPYTIGKKNALGGVYSYLSMHVY